MGDQARLPRSGHRTLETRDLVSNTRSSALIAIATGILTGSSANSAGSPIVEQRDAESLVGDFDLPPIVTKTWFHNGAFLEEGALEAYFKDPANQEFFAGDPQAAFLPGHRAADRTSLAMKCAKPRAR